MVEWNQGALAAAAFRSLRAQSSLVRLPDELRPESMNSLREGLDQRVGDVVEECRILIEIRQVDSFELETFALEVILEEVDDRALGCARVEDRVEVGKDLLRRFGRRLVDDGLWVTVRLRQVQGLEELRKPISS